MQKKAKSLRYQKNKRTIDYNFMQLTINIQQKFSFFLLTDVYELQRIKKLTKSILTEFKNNNMKKNNSKEQDS